MENSVALGWKAFNVNLDKVAIHFKAILTANYDGMVCDPDHLYVIFKTPPSVDEIQEVEAYWASLHVNSFALTLKEIITKKLTDATSFGQSILVDAMVENIELGITQAGKTKQVSDYCENLIRYLQSGSLYAALNELEVLENQGLPPELEPFITQARLDSMKAKILAYVAV